MNTHELLHRVCLGHLLLVGEVMAADVREVGLIDTKTGLRATAWLITYFVGLTRVHEFKVAKITRRLPVESPDPASAPTGVEKGKCYAFEIESAERKHGFLLARLAAVEPALIEAEGAVPPVAAPTGGARGGAVSNLVYMQTTPRTP